MSKNAEGIVNILAALLVLFTAMLDPRISIVLAIVLLIAMAIYKFIKK